jgi:uncharacterized protein (DUF58 family)
MLLQKSLEQDKPFVAPSASDILRSAGAVALPVNWRGGNSLAPAGLRRSRAPGDLGDFHSLRPFAPGDRVRSINWRATAATGAQEVLREVRLEEQPIDVFLVVNTGASMNFGTVRVLKRHVAAEITAAVGLSAGRSKDRLGCITYGGTGVEYSSPARSPERQVLPAISAVLKEGGSAGGADSVSAAGLRLALSSLPARRSLVFIVSDFFECDDEAQQAALQAAAGRHQVVAIQIEDPRENELPQGFGIISLAAVGGGPERIVLLTSSCRRLFADQARRRKLALQGLFEQAGVQWTCVSTADRLEVHAQKVQAALHGA